MKSPREHLSELLAFLERRWVPYHNLWWRYWTPRMDPGDRYHTGVFASWIQPNYGDSVIGEFAFKTARKIEKNYPYVEVDTVVRPWETMTDEERRAREQFIIETTRSLYDSGKAIYSRSTIRDIESQITAHEGSKKPCAKIFSKCEAPQTAFVKYRDLDGVMHHQRTWKSGAAIESAAGQVIVYGRSQLEFRTIQELTMPDPDNRKESFVPDQWLPSVGYNPITVVEHRNKSHLRDCLGDLDDQLSYDRMKRRWEQNRSSIRQNPRWVDIASTTHSSPVLQAVDKIFFFYASGMSDGYELCKRAMFLLALATKIRDLAQSNDNQRAKIPIYILSSNEERTWNKDELKLFESLGVTTADSIGDLFLMVDENTAVISYRCWAPVKQVIADLARPAIMVCKPVRGSGRRDFAFHSVYRNGELVKIPSIRSRRVNRRTSCDDSDSPRVRKMFKDYDKLHPPNLPQEWMTREDIAMYLRKPDAPVHSEYYDEGQQKQQSHSSRKGGIR
ncbi:hypothetical protein GQ53DRAFT_525680 [Thozetella sp. PMI_491]|nr:hypothetical protein GQ53DRAFT_525680 [Thozetella sp. PMI_491]